jgi:hypothetical protein
VRSLQVRRQAIEDMSCPEPEVTVAPARTTTGAPTDSGVYYAEGCKQVRRYSVGCNIFGYCPHPQGVNVLELVQRQGGFDLKCDQSKVTVQRLNTDTFGATGCDHQASYVLVCSAGDCRVVQNTQSQ